jgi:hypothetical protein
MLPLWEIGCPGAHDGKRLAQLLIELGNVEHPNPGGYQLDGERKTVDPPHNRSDCTPVRTFGVDLDPMFGSAVDKQTDGRRNGTVARVEPEGLHLMDDLTPDAQRGSARYEQGDDAAPRNEVCNDRAAADHVLEVVDDEECWVGDL